MSMIFMLLEPNSFSLENCERGKCIFFENLVSFTRGKCDEISLAKVASLCREATQTVFPQHFPGGFRSRIYFNMYILNKYR